jgi:hypothetical protein
MFEKRHIEPGKDFKMRPRGAFFVSGGRSGCQVRKAPESEIY